MVGPSLGTGLVAALGYRVTCWLIAASFLLIVLLVENASHYARLAHLSTKLVAANVALEQLSLHDPLTALPNRRFFDQHLAKQISLARRHQRELALILCAADWLRPAMAASRAFSSEVDTRFASRKRVKKRI